jgi:hypothetical protein
MMRMVVSMIMTMAMIVNNIAFKLKRKRLIIETLHLGVEGGVGERRTEPTSTGGAVDMRKIKREAAGHDHGHSHSFFSGGASLSAVDGLAGSPSSIEMLTAAKRTEPRQARAV